MGNKRNTFIVKIMREQNDTWQGSIRCAEKNKTEYFRSALEMIHLMDDAMQGGDNRGKE